MLVKFCITEHKELKCQILQQISDRLGSKVLNYLKQQAENCGFVQGVAKSQDRIAAVHGVIHKTRKFKRKVWQHCYLVAVSLCQGDKSWPILFESCSN